MESYEVAPNTTYEPYFNYPLGIFAAGCALISTTINPLIFYVYNKKDRSVKNFLFNVTAVSDFLTNLLPATFLGYVCFSSTRFNQYTLLNQTPEFLSCTLGCVSQVAVTLMAVARMIKVIRPFYRLKFKWVKAYLVCYTLYMVLGNGGFLLLGGVSGKKAGTNANLFIIETWNKYICFAMNMTHCFLGLICSFITVGYLRLRVRGIGEHANKMRGSNTILIMNIPYVISIVTNFLALQHYGINFDLVNHYLIPIFTSAFNPCVIVVRSKGIRTPACSVFKNMVSVSSNQKSAVAAAVPAAVEY